MKYLMMMAMVFGAAGAQADGFVCQNDDIRVKVYNNTDPGEGTRTAAVMVLSDPSVSHGRKTIAKFTDVKSRLASRGANYVADVDLRVSESRRGGEYIGGTRLGQLDQIILAVDFVYGEDMQDGESLRSNDRPLQAELILVKRSGGKISMELDCERYLKN